MYPQYWKPCKHKRGASFISNCVTIEQIDGQFANPIIRWVDDIKINASDVSLLHDQTSSCYVVHTALQTVLKQIN